MQRGAKVSQSLIKPEQRQTPVKKGVKQPFPPPVQVEPSPEKPSVTPRKPRRNDDEGTANTEKAP